MLALFRGPSHLEFRIQRGACCNRSREFAANPLAVPFMDQIKKALVAPVECAWSQPEKGVHPFIPPNRRSRHIPIPSSHFRGTQREI